MNVWMDVSMDGWMDGWIDQMIYESMDWWIDGFSIDALTDESMDQFIGGPVESKREL